MAINRRSLLLKGGGAMALGVTQAAGQSANTQAPGIHWDAEADVVVVGSGASGMTAAVVAVIRGTGGSTSNVNFRRMFDPRLTEEYCGAAGMLWSEQDGSGEIAAMAVGASLWGWQTAVATRRAASVSTGWRERPAKASSPGAALPPPRHRERGLTVV